LSLLQGSKAGKTATNPIAWYPHKILMKKQPDFPMSEVQHPDFVQRVLRLNKVVDDFGLICISGPKAKWEGRIILLKTVPGSTEYETWVNPIVEGYDDKTSVAPMYGQWEMCASCQFAAAWVIRPQSIVVRGYDEFGKYKEEKLDDMRARALLHEMDHLEGKSVFHQVLSPEFIVSTESLSQKDLWPRTFPSIEAFETPPLFFFDYVRNCVLKPPGLEHLIEMSLNNKQRWNNNKIDETDEETDSDRNKGSAK
jgi:peptide deformylase